jgi:hypothetical protein
VTDLGEPLPPLPEPGYDPDIDDPGASRRRALWVMVVLACLALIVGCLMVLLGGGSGPKQHHINLLPPVHTPSSSAPRATQSGAAGRSTSPSTGTATSPSLATSTAPAGPPRRGNPCAGSSSCVVGGDGGALAAVNAYRTAHGVPAVPGGVSSNAQICAQDKGSGPTCVPHYAWTALADQNGARAVRKIADFGSDWLLDQSVKTISVGWAYVGGQYECVLLKAP